MEHYEVLDLTARLASEYLEKLDTKGFSCSQPPQELLKRFDFTIDTLATPPEKLQLLITDYLENSVPTLHPHFMNQLFSGLRPWAIAGELLSLVTNTTMATYEASPVATIMEKTLVEYLASVVGWKQHDGIMVTGGSNANLVGLLMARNKLHPSIKQCGSSPRPLVAFVSEEAHYSFEKAFNVLGLGLNNLRSIHTTSSGQIDTTALESEIKKSKDNGEYPFFVAATAGTTVMGEFDPIDELAKITQKEKLWLHVDGAWGASVLLSQTHRKLMRGIEQADSLAWDTHKMLGTGLVSSFFLTRHSNGLRESHSGGGGDYIFHETNEASWDRGPSSLQCGRKTDAVKTWFAWKSLGKSGMNELVDQLMGLAQNAANLIKEYPEFELITQPTSLNVCFRVKGYSNDNKLLWHRSLREKLMKNGLGMVNIASRKGDSFIRLIVSHPQQDTLCLTEFFDNMVKVAKSLEV